MYSSAKALKEIEAEKEFAEIIERIKKDGEGKDYSCLCGISGGADSSTALHYAVELGLNRLLLLWIMVGTTPEPMKMC